MTSSITGNEGPATEAFDFERSSCQVTIWWNSHKARRTLISCYAYTYRHSVRCCLFWELKQVLACSSSCRCELLVSLYHSSPSIRTVWLRSCVALFYTRAPSLLTVDPGANEFPDLKPLWLLPCTERQPWVPETTLVIATLRRAATLTMCTRHNCSHCNSERQPHWQCGPETTSVITPQRGNRIAWDIIQTENIGWVNLADCHVFRTVLETAWSVL